MRYLVSFGEVTRAVSVDDKDELLSAAKNAFEVISPCALEYKDPVFGLYVRADKPSEIPEGTVLRLVLLIVDGNSTQEGSDITTISKADTMEVVTAEQLAGTQVVILGPSAVSPSNSDLGIVSQTDYDSSAQACTMTGSLPLGGTDVLSLGSGSLSTEESTTSRAPSLCSSRGGAGEPSTHHNVSSNEEPLQSSFFDASTLTRGLRVKLEEGATKLQQRDWSEITDTIFRSFVDSTKSQLPSTAQYDKMAASILQSFPPLRGSLSLGDALVWLKRIIKDKFKNKRRIKRKAVPDDGTEEDPLPRKRCRVAGMPNYLPLLGETQATSLVKTQQRVNQLKDPDADVDKLMVETFPARRRAIVVEGLAIQTIKEDFWPLFTKPQFLRELDRMTGDENFLQSAVQKYDEKMKTLASTLGTTPDKAPEQLRRLLMGQAALLYPEIETTPTPILVGTEPPFGLVMNGHEVASFDTATEAVITLVMAHSVFHVKYPLKMKAYGVYLERYVLGIDDGTKVPRKTLTVMQSLTSSK